MRKKIQTTVFVFAAVVCVLSWLPAAAAERAAAPLTCILGAFDDEVVLLHQALTDSKEEEIRGIHFARGTMQGRRVIICRSGIGKVNAAMVTALMIQHCHPSEVIFSGIAGGINPDLHPGDIVMAAKTAQHDFGVLTSEGMEVRGTKSAVTWERNPVFLEPDARLLALAEVSSKRIRLADITTSEGKRHPHIIKGVVVTGDVFVASSEKTAQLRKALGADAVEMEGAAVAQVCRDLHVPWLLIRSISDKADSHALQDVDSFMALAAKNSASLVMDIVAHLAPQSTSATTGK